MKQDIVTHKLLESKISVLFKDIYPIYKFMDSKDLLNTEDEYIHYINIYNEIFPKLKEEREDVYVPHNIHYLNEIEQKKYENIKSANKDMLGDYFNKNRKSLDQVLSKLDECNDEFDGVTFDLGDM